MEALVFNKPLFLLWWHTTYPQSLFALIISFSPNFIRPGNWSVHTAAHSRSLQSGGLSDPPRACLQPHPNWNYRRYRKNSCLGSRKILFFGVELWAVVFKLECLIMNPSSFPFVLSKVVKKGQRQFTLLHFRLTRALLSPMEVCALYSKPCLFFLLKMIYSPPPFFFCWGLQSAISWTNRKRRGWDLNLWNLSILAELGGQGADGKGAAGRTLPIRESSLR